MWVPIIANSCLDYCSTYLMFVSKKSKKESKKNLNSFSVSLYSYWHFNRNTQLLVSDIMSEIERVVSLAFGGSFNHSLVSTIEKSACLLTYRPVFRLSAPSSCLHSILVTFVCHFCDRIFKVNQHRGWSFFKDNINVAAQFSKQFNCVMLRSIYETENDG